MVSQRCAQLVDTSILGSLLSGTPQHLRVLDLQFHTCDHLADISQLGLALEALGNLQELSVEVIKCNQLRDLLGFEIGFQGLKQLQLLQLKFNYCEQLKDVSSLAAGLRAVGSLVELTLDFRFCDQLQQQEFAAVQDAIASLQQLQLLTLNFQLCKQLYDGADLLPQGLSNLRQLQISFENSEQLSDVQAELALLGKPSQQLTMEIEGCSQLNSQQLDKLKAALGGVFDKHESRNNSVVSLEGHVDI